MANVTEAIKEEIVVLFHAASLGRTDIVQSAIKELRGKCSPEEASRIISSGRPEDGATPLHIAAKLGHSDVIRALLVGFPASQSFEQLKYLFSPSNYPRMLE